MTLATNYSPEQIRLEQIRQYSEEGLRFYEPHPTQMAFHRSQAQQRGLFGGNQSGKTFAGCMEVAYAVGKCHPYRLNEVGKVFARDCCVSFATIKAILIPTYQRLLPRKRCNLSWQTFEGKPAVWPGLRGGKWKTAWNEQDKMLYMEDGGFIEFKSYEQGRESMQGARRHIIRHDEEPSEAIAEENMARQITLTPNILFTLTPLNYSQWLYQSIYQGAAQSDKIDAFMMSVYDNPYTNEESIEAVKRKCTDPAIEAARLHGEFTFLSGRVYKEYGEHNWATPFIVPQDWRRSLVIDPHLSKPTAVNLFADDPKGITYCIAEGDFEGDVNEISNQIRVMCGGQKIEEWYIDPSSLQSTKIHGKERLIDEFRKHFKFLIAANNNRELGWDRVRRAVKERPNLGAEFRCFRSCPVTHHQMLNYMWKPPLPSGVDRNKPEVHKKADDHPDNVRYKFMSKVDQGVPVFTGFNTGGMIH